MDDSGPRVGPPCVISIVPKHSFACDDEGVFFSLQGYFNESLVGVHCMNLSGNLVPIRKVGVKRIAKSYCNAGFTVGLHNLRCAFRRRDGRNWSKKIVHADFIPMLAFILQEKSSL
jgi:hypothetical protein